MVAMLRHENRRKAREARLDVPISTGGSPRFADRYSAKAAAGSVVMVVVVPPVIIPVVVVVVIAVATVVVPVTPAAVSAPTISVGNPRE